jgi:hypothetical protein
MSQPIHKHDCDVCKYLGSFEKNGRKVDGWYCPDQVIGGATVIARFSNDGPDYSSMPINMIQSLIGEGKKVNPYLLDVYSFYNDTYGI